MHPGYSKNLAYTCRCMLAMDFTVVIDIELISRNLRGGSILLLSLTAHWVVSYWSATSIESSIHSVDQCVPA